MKTIQQTVEQIDAARKAYFERSPDRPQGRVRTRTRKPAEVVKAESRMRTAAWRASLDKRGRPETDQVALQFLPETKKAFDKMFNAMAERGFQRNEVVEAVVKRLTRRAR
jgi:hypothetical protein